VESVIERLPLPSYLKEQLKRAVRRAVEKYGLRIVLKYLLLSIGEKDLNTETIMLDPFNIRDFLRDVRYFVPDITPEEFIYSIILHEHLHNIFANEYPQYFSLIEEYVDHLKGFFTAREKKIPFTDSGFLLNIITDYFLDLLLSEKHLRPEDRNIYKKAVYATHYTLIKGTKRTIEKEMLYFITHKTPADAASIHMDVHMMACSCAALFRITGRRDFIYTMEKVFSKEKRVLSYFRELLDCFLSLKRIEDFPEVLKRYVKTSMNFADFLRSYVWGGR